MINIDNLSFIYKESEDLNGVSNINLKIKSGECVLLCGKSGCGKTTITRLINGLIPHFYDGKLSGNVNIDGENIIDCEMYKIATKVGSVFQNPKSQFFNVDTNSEIVFGIENLSYPVELINERFNETVKDLELNSLLNKSIFKLSGGEKQKIAFASVYALTPDIYVLDEPSSNLDVHAIDDLRKLLVKIKKKGKTIIIAEHRLYYLKDLADRIIYMENGKIVNEYTKDEFKNISYDERLSKGLRTMNYKNIRIPFKINSNKNSSLIIKNLELRYGKTLITKNINIEATSGDVIAIIGKNGTGKSTFARALCGLLKENNGLIMYKDKKIKLKDRLKLSFMVLQDVNYQLFASSVEEECYLGQKKYDLDNVHSILKDLDLYKYKDNHPMSLSGGEKQRTAVAISMLSKKDIIIFDEPTSGLDLSSMHKVGKLIERLSSENKIIFIVTHDYEFIVNNCNRVICFEKEFIKDDYKLVKENINKLHEFFTNVK